MIKNIVLICSKKIWRLKTYEVLCFSKQHGKVDISRNFRSKETWVLILYLPCASCVWANYLISFLFAKQRK